MSRHPPPAAGYSMPVVPEEPENSTNSEDSTLSGRGDPDKKTRPVAFPIEGDSHYDNGKLPGVPEVPLSERDLHPRPPQGGPSNGVVDEISQHLRLLADLLDKEKANNHSHPAGPNNYSRHTVYSECSDRPMTPPPSDQDAQPQYPQLLSVLQAAKSAAGPQPFAFPKHARFEVVAPPQSALKVDCPLRDTANGNGDNLQRNESTATVAKSRSRHTITIARAGRSKDRMSMFSMPSKANSLSKDPRATKRLSERVRDLIEVYNQDEFDEEIEIDGLRGSIGELVRNRKFEFFVCSTILANAIMMGFQADHRARLGTYNEELTQVDTVFTLLFLSELLVRVYVEQRYFFIWNNVNFSWNVFDTFVVCSSCIDEGLVIVTKQSMLVNVTVLRILRLLRLVRIVRVARAFRFFRDLRVMVMGILSCLQSLSWALMLLFALTYLCSVFVMEVVDFDLFVVGADVSEAPFANMWRALYTLTKCVFGGIDWGDVVDSHFGNNPMLVGGILTYIIFTMLVVLNIVTGVFVENASKITLKAEHDLVLEQLEIRRDWLNKVKLLFQKADVEGRGRLDADGFVKFMQDVKVQKLFRKLGIEVERTHLKGIFSLLDLDQNGSLDCEEFATSLSQLSEKVSGMNFLQVRSDFRAQMRGLDRKVDFLLEALATVIPEARPSLFMQDEIGGGSMGHFASSFQDD
eukprot:TRINITY_DN8123_c0_g1_i1.p1 TRINITY_DN8123_c0_g1~~TRINITY_DN8123_c0_g1_i1.p1  ORF type:complete len:690 (+),score=167.63 TRINITY_DN8123_c0_g1_i1:287-2356(+)